MTRLDQLPAGARGRIAAVTGDAALVQRLMEFGVLEGEEIEVVGFAPLGDPMEVRLANTRLSLRRTEAAGITVEMQSPLPAS
jgi:ferrous iron transport protein A